LEGEGRGERREVGGEGGGRRQKAEDLRKMRLSLDLI